MDEDVTFYADANIDTAQKNLPRNRQTGKAIVTAALGGIDVRNDRDYDEDAPLLGTQSPFQDGRSGDRGDGNDSGSDATLIPEYDQWAGLPWYKRPSVSSIVSSNYRFKTNNYCNRFTGSSYLLSSLPWPLEVSLSRKST
jgi:hypothetical protein